MKQFIYLLILVSFMTWWVNSPHAEEKSIPEKKQECIDRLRDGSLSPGEPFTHCILEATKTIKF